jgi:hypothetical protein
MDEETKTLLFKIIKAKTRVERLKREKKVLLDELYIYCIDSERPPATKKRITKSKKT